MQTNFLKPLALSPADRLQLEMNSDNTRFVADIFQVSRLDSARHTFASHAATRTFIQRIPERQKLRGLERWAFAATDFTAKVIQATWPRSQVEFSEEAKITFGYLVATQRNSEEIARNVARFQKSGEVPAHSLRLHDVHPLANYQQLALTNTDRCEGYALFMEQGTGKTPIAIAQICNDADRLTEDRMYRAVVVCPKNVRLNWQKEFEKFSTTKGQVTVLRGGEIQRAKQFIEAFTKRNGLQYTVVVCGYETMVRAWKILRMIEWDLAVLDESHFIKSPHTRRFKYAMKLRQTAKKRMILTGTPVTNHVLDLYAQFEFLGQGFSGFSSWKNFRSFYGVFKQDDDSGFRRLIAVQNLPLMKERLSRLAYIIRKEEALPDLPEKVHDVHEVEMTSEQAELYENLRKHLIIEIKADLEGTQNKALVIKNVLVKLLRLAQITSGHIVWDAQFDENDEMVQPRTVEHLPVNPKIDALIGLLKEKGPNDKTLVWACWVPDIEEVSRRLAEAELKHVTFYGATSDKDRAIAEHNFNHDVKTKVFVGNPIAGGVGLNLLGYPPEDEDSYTTNCNHVIYFSQNWSPTARSQSEDRAHRRGTRRNVRITDLCVPGTIDEEIRARVLQKRLDAYEVSDVRQILASVLKDYLDG